MPHIHEKVDFVADTYVVHKNKVLLRMHDKYHMWLTPGGHIETDEDPNEAALREVKEEVGLNVKLVGERPTLSTVAWSEYRDLLPPRFMNRHRINETHEHISLVFFATTETDDIVQGETEVSENVRWFTAGELDDPAWEIVACVRYYAKRALEELGTTA